MCLGVFLWTTLSLSGLKMIFETFALMRILPTFFGMFYLLYLQLGLLVFLLIVESFLYFLCIALFFQT
ncbi:hypothetical protein [Helicobacter suis]|uniref:hypothetical protein n=1 Tax=Helicobacter suis TaxID=104628 RepID=UPI0031F7DDC8